LTPTSAPASRILDWEGCFNVRDLGGLSTSSGRPVRHRALVRSDILHRLTDAGRAALVAHGVRSIIDLRFTDEVATDWHMYPFRAPADGVSYRNIPFDLGRDAASNARQRDAYHAASSRAELNRLDLDGGRAGIVAAVAAIADAPPGGVLVHCHAGKDRTGAVVAVVLSMLGVSDDDIADDYALTALTLEPLIIEWLDDSSQDPVEREQLRDLAMPVREAMLDTLEYLDERYGSAETYLRDGGLTHDEVDRLRLRLLEAT